MGLFALFGLVELGGFVGVCVFGFFGYLVSCLFSCGSVMGVVVKRKLY